MSQMTLAQFLAFEKKVYASPKLELVNVKDDQDSNHTYDGEDLSHNLCQIIAGMGSDVVTKTVDFKVDVLALDGASKSTGWIDPDAVVQTYGL